MNIEFTHEEAKYLLNKLLDLDDDKKVVGLIQNIESAINKEEEFQEFLVLAPYKLSENQVKFVRDCYNLDLEIDWDYSGRAMYGRKCPAVVISSGGLSTTAQYCADNMGCDMVYYASS